jgi:hypothetical protein
LPPARATWRGAATLPLPYRGYTLRHTAIPNWLAAGLTVFEVSRHAGTSVPMIDEHYGHLAIGHEDAARAKLNARLGA